MKKIVLTLLAFLLTIQFGTFMPSSAGAAGGVDWEVQASWKLDVKPLDLVQSLDNQKVFILGDDNNVYMYSAQGEKLATIPVDKGVSAIDIAPRGEMLYLINGQENSYTSLAISFITPIDITGSPFLGDDNAPVVLAVFSDFQ